MHHFHTLSLLPHRLNAARSSTIARSHSEYVPRLEANQGFITAQEVRNIRAQLRNMSEPKTSTDPQSQLLDHRRIDTDHPGVPGTLVLTDVLDEQVPPKRSSLIVVRGFIAHEAFPDCPVPIAQEN